MYLKKYKETIMYLLFGVLTIIINIITYVFSNRVLNLDYLTSNLIAWIIAVVFAYISNKFFVFNSYSKNFYSLLKEFTAFLSCRIASGVLEMIIMYIMVDIFSIDDFFVKLVTNIVVVILNFLFSKIFIFNKDKYIKSYKID